MKKLMLGFIVMVSIVIAGDSHAVNWVSVGSNISVDIDSMNGGSAFKNDPPVGWFWMKRDNTEDRYEWNVWCNVKGKTMWYIRQMVKPDGTVFSGRNISTPIDMPDDVVGGIAVNLCEKLNERAK